MVELFLIVNAVAIVVVFTLYFNFTSRRPVSQDTEDIDTTEFESLNGSYPDQSQYWLISKRLRVKFEDEGRSKKYFEYLDLLNDQFWVKSKVFEHYSALKKNMLKRVKKNDYGKVIKDDRSDEVIEFLSSIGYQPKIIPADCRLMLETIEEALEDADEQLKNMDFDASSAPDDGIEFEYWVASNLEKFGWNAEVTQGAGDQGLDVVVTKNGCRVGIQCKRYSSNVGNKAVQEINAAKAHFNLDKAAVLTNASYTKSARELAQTCGIHLLSHFDIPRFDELFLD